MEVCPCCDLEYSETLRPLLCSCGHVVCVECSDAMMKCQPAVCLICGWFLHLSPSPKSAVDASELPIADCIETLDKASQRCTERCLQQASKTARIPVNRTQTRCKLHEDAASFRSLLARHYANVEADIDSVAAQWMEEACAMEASLLSLRSRILETLDVSSGEIAEKKERIRICNRLKTEAVDWKEHARVLPSMPRPENFANAAQAVIEAMKPLPMDLLGGSVEANGMGCFGFLQGQFGHNQIVLQYKDAAGQRALWVGPSDVSVTFSSPDVALVNIKTCGKGVVNLSYRVDDHLLDKVVIVIRVKNLTSTFEPRGGGFHCRHVDKLELPRDLSFWYGLKISSDDSRAMYFGLQTLVLMEPRGGKLEATLSLPTIGRACAFLTRDILLTVSADYAIELRHWDGAVFDTVALEPQIAVHNIDASGDLIAAGCCWRSGVLLLLNATTRTEIRRIVFEGHDILALCVSFDGSCVYVILRSDQGRGQAKSLVRVGLDGKQTTLFVERHRDEQQPELLRWKRDVIWTRGSTCRLFCGSSGVQLCRWSMVGTAEATSSKHLYVREKLRQRLPQHVQVFV